MVIDSLSDQAPGAVDDESSARRRVAPTIESDLGLHIARDGRWLYRGSPIGRIELVKLFASVLRREADGSYWLVTPVERGRVEVEDAPFVAVELQVEGAGRDQRLLLRSNLDEWVGIGPSHPLRLRRFDDDPPPGGLVPYVEFHPGLEARLARPVFYELVELGQELRRGDRSRFGVWSEGQFFALDDDAA